MEMNQVRYFLAIARELNFTRAAASCNVSQPSLTRAIKMLEMEFGGPLFHRDRRQTHLSELGRMVLPHLQQVYEEAALAKRRAHDAGKLTRAPLKLGLMCTIAPGTFVELIRSVRIRHPGIELLITDADAVTLLRGLETGELDVALCCEPDGEALERLHRIELFRERFVIAISVDHPLAGLEKVRVCDLNGQHYLDRINCEYAGHATRVFEEQGVSDRTVYKSDREDWILAIAAAGIGYAFMPEHCAQHPEIVIRPLVEPEIWREVSLVTVRDRPHSAAVGAFLGEVMRARKQGLFTTSPRLARARK